MSNTNLKNFISTGQMAAMLECLKGEEADFFQETFENVYKTVSEMPKPYETDGQADNAVVHLHYFLGGCDWYITERDCSNEQLQAFGFANLNDPQNAELGYISIQEITAAGGELDLHWSAKTLAEVKAGI